MVANIVTNGAEGQGQEIMIVDMNNNNSTEEEQLAIGIPASLGEIESAIAEKLEGIKVGLFDKMKAKKKQQRGNGGSLGIMSSEEVDEEEDDEEYFN